MKRYFLLALALCVLVHIDANASTLFGRVIEVNSGDVITIYNLNRPVRIRLLGIDAPEMDQAFGDVARKHLSELVHDKSVLVDYSGIAADRSLTGRVLLNNIDVGAQMIRDGAAWVDPGNQDRLSSTDREVYQLSQEAARSERRGLWQAENPVAPWEFVRAKAFKRDPVASLDSLFRRSKMSGPVPELTNLSLMGRRTESSRAPSGDEPMVKWHRTQSSDWIRLRPAGEKFSALVPSDGEQMTMPDKVDPSIEYPVYNGQDGMTRYAIAWMNLPTNGESDQDAIHGIVKNAMEGFGQQYKEAGVRRGMNVGFSCELENEKNVSMNSFTGTEFDLRSCTVPARVKVFTRLMGKQRKAYVAFAFYMEESANVKRFIDSFVLIGTEREGRSR